jgi:pyruvate dehydrogenase E2 component (dihydrolipoamide acetyltransferase)
MPELVMPRLSDSMEEATVVEWFKAVGDEVAVDEEVATVETDKATVPLEATDAGVIEAILVGAGETVALGAVLARVRAGAREPAAAAPARAKASPVARRIAGRHGIDLHTVRGTGPDGRVVKGDLAAFVEAATTAVTAAPSGTGGRAASAGEAAPERRGAVPAARAPRVGAAPATRAPRVGAAAGARALTRSEQVIARRMIEAKSTIPEFVVRMEADMEACADVRERLGGEPSYNDFVVKACALALREHPRVNSSFGPDGITEHERVNVGIAVAGERRLTVPVLTDADTRPLGDLARAAARLANLARTGDLSPQDLEHGTFTVSNLGMFGVTGFTAVINPPQAAILAVGAVERRAVPDGEALAIRRRVELSLTCDHRVLYGADAARFLARVRELLEQPLELLYRSRP